MEDVHSYLSATLAVILAAITAIIYTAYFNHLTSKNDIIKDYLQDINEIERLCREYWLFKVRSEVDAETLNNIGHELRAKMEATGHFESLSKDILGKNFDRFSELDFKLFTTATGGSFQTSEFSKSPETYSEIMSIISDIRNLLRSQRNSMFWAR